MISEADLRDWEHTDIVPLYSVPRNTYVLLDNEYFFFDHIDGMYSFCLDMNNNIIHIPAWQEVIPLRKPA